MEIAEVFGMTTAEEITTFINAIQELNGVGICYYDLNEFFHYDQFGVKKYRGHYCAFCEKARALPDGKGNCEKSDRTEAVLYARQYREPFFYECHMGMRELVLPLFRDDTLLGVLFVGHCRTDDDQDSVVLTNTQRAGGDPVEFLSLFHQLPLISQKDLLNIGKLLSQYFELKILNNELISPGVTTNPSGQDLAGAMRNFIHSNYRSDISPQKIAREFHVNASYASRCFHKKNGMSMIDYIYHIRIGRAKSFLQATDAPIRNIAMNVGFSDYNYFSRVFKQKVGCSPQQYRKRKKESSAE